MMSITFFIFFSLTLAIVDCRTIPMEEGSTLLSKGQLDENSRMTMGPQEIIKSQSKIFTHDEIEEVEEESSSMANQGGSDRDDEEEEEKLKIPGHTNTVIIVYLLVLMTIIVKTAPNAIYYLLPKIETVEEKAVEAVEVAAEDVEKKPACPKAVAGSQSEPPTLIVIVEGGNEPKILLEDSPNCVHSFTLHV